jgi:hypothetical protein
LPMLQARDDKVKTVRPEIDRRQELVCCPAHRDAGVRR